MAAPSTAAAASTPFPRVHTCNATLVAESDSAPVYQRCSRCCDAYYSTHDAQRAHWKLHKITCAPAVPAALAALSLTDCCYALRHQLAELSATGVHLSRVIRLLRHHFQLYADGDEVGRAEMSVHTTARSLIGVPDSAESHAYFARLWAAPGMAELLLTGEDLLDPIARDMRAAFPLGHPSGEARRLLPSLGDDHHAALLERALYSLGATNTAYFVSYCYLNLLLGSACSGIGPNSAHDGAGTLRSGLVAEAAAARYMALWVDPWVRLCCGDALLPGMSFALTMVRERGSIGCPGELAPGVPVDAVVIIAMDELLSDGPAGGYAEELLRLAADRGEDVWVGLPPARRARFLIRLVLRLRTVAASSPFSGPYDPLDDLSQGRALRLIAAASGTTNAADRLQTWSAAAAGRELCGPGQDAEARAFFLWLLQRVGAEGHAAAAGGGSDPLAADLAAQLALWNATPWPSAVSGEISAESAAKLSCMLHVLEPELAAEWKPAVGIKCYSNLGQIDY